MSFSGKTDNDKSNADPYERILRLVDYSDRSIFEVRNRLVREGYSEDTIQVAIERACDFGILDDSRYARIYCRSKLSRGNGSQGIIRDLRSVEIDVETLPGYPQDYLPVTEEEECCRAYAYLERKPPQGNNIREKAYRALMRKGYASSVSSSVARIWCDKINNVSEPKSFDF